MKISKKIPILKQSKRCRLLFDKIIFVLRGRRTLTALIILFLSFFNYLDNRFDFP